MQSWVTKHLEEKEAGVLLHLYTGLLSTAESHSICPSEGLKTGIPVDRLKNVSPFSHGDSVVEAAQVAPWPLSALQPFVLRQKA